MSRSVIGQLRVALGLDSAQFQKGVKQAESRVAVLGRSMQRLGASMALVGIGLALAIRGNLNAADEMGKAAQRVGMGVEDLSQLKHAADLSGVSMEQLETGLKSLARNMVDNAGRFTDLGIKVRDSAGNMRPMQDVLADVADVLAKMPDGAERTATAMALLGKSGSDLLPMMSDGAEGLRKAAEEANKLGIVITPEMAASAQTFNDNLDRLGAALRGVMMQITAELAPIMERISGALVSLASGFGNLPEPLKKFLAGVVGITGALLLALIPVGLMVSALSALSAPVVLVVAGLGLLAVRVADLWPEIIAAKDAMIAFGRDALEWVTGKLDALMAKMEGFVIKLGEMATALTSVFATTDTMSGMARDMDRKYNGYQKDDAIGGGGGGGGGGAAAAGAAMADGLVLGFRTRLGALQGEIAAVAAGLVAVTRAQLGIQSPSTVFRGIGRFIMEGLGLGIQDGAAGPVAAIGRASQDMLDVGQRVGQAAGQLRSNLEQAFVGIVTGAQSAREAISQLLNTLAQAAAKGLFNALFGALFGGGRGGGGGLNLFGGARAEGGPVARGMAYLVGERGPELFVPGAAGGIVPNGGGGGGGSGFGGGVLRVSLAEGLVAEMLGQARDQSVEIMREGLTRYDRSALPARLAQISNDPRGRR